MNSDFVKNVIIWVIILVIAVVITQPAHGADEELVVSVVHSDPYYGANQKYSKQCDSQSGKCFLIGEPPTHFATTFTNGRTQFTILTMAKFPQDVWFNVIRNCDSGKCQYKSAIMSEYQSPETLAISEILTKERAKYINNPRRMY